MSIVTKLASLRLVNNDQYTNAIAEANVEIEISDETKTTKHLIVGKFDTNNISNFIDFSNISNEQVMDWVFSQFVGREELLSKLQEIHNNAQHQQITNMAPPEVNGFKFGKISV